MNDDVFTDEQLAEDGKNRVGKTTGQVGLATAAVTLVEWIVTGAHLDSGHFPLAVSGALVTALTFAASYATNRRRIRATKS